jgi:hypothetical protein
MSNEKNDGGPAFPEMIKVDGLAYSKGGLSMRDWFAGQALHGLMAYDPHVNAYNMACDCYMIADAMLKARAQ